MSEDGLRLGIDVGYTHLTGVVTDTAGAVLTRTSLDMTTATYEGAIERVVELVGRLESEAGEQDLPVGLAVPGREEPTMAQKRRLARIELHSRALVGDVAEALGRDVIGAHRAGCLASAAYADEAAGGAERLFAVLLDDSVDGAVMVGGELLGGPSGRAGDWAHISLPWPTPAEARHAPPCWCGTRGCIEAWLAGAAMTTDHVRRGGHRLAPSDILARAEAGERLAGKTLREWLSRTARALAMIVRVLEPDAIVLGGELGRISWLYSEVPRIWSNDRGIDPDAIRLLSSPDPLTLARGAALRAAGAPA